MTMTTDKETMLNFPFQKQDWDEPMSDAQLARQTKLALTKMLNRATTGEYVLTEKNKADIAYYNEIVTRCGYEPIDVDLTQF